MILIIGIAFNFIIFLYQFILHKKKEEFKLTIKHEILMFGFISTIQTICFVLNRNVNIIFLLGITYLVIQAYTDFKTQFVYRFISYIFILIDSIMIIIYHQNIRASQLIILIFIVFFIVCSIAGVFGWGDTISIGATIPIYLISYGSNAVVLFFISFFCSTITFVVFNLAKKTKRNPFMPHWLGGYLLAYFLLFAYGKLII